MRIAIVTKYRCWKYVCMFKHGIYTHKYKNNINTLSIQLIHQPAKVHIKTNKKPASHLGPVTDVAMLQFYSC